MRRALRTVGLILPLLAAPAASNAGGDGVGTSLMEMDRRFAATVATEGLAGWLSFMADDAVRLPGLAETGVRGKDAIAELDGGMFSDPTRQLVWEPTDAGGFADGRHGYTTGRYRVVVTADGKETVTATGTYITMWRLDESWKVILDTGAPD